MYADLEESLGTVDSTKAIYNRIVDLKIATPQIIINYALFLEENKFFEEAFKVSIIYTGLKCLGGEGRTGQQTILNTLTVAGECSANGSVLLASMLDE